MNANLESIAEELFGKIRTRFPNIQLGDENGKVVANESDIGQARFFEFDYVKEGVPLGSVSIQLSEDNGITVMYSNDLTEGQDQRVVNEWYSFLKSLREFAKKRLLNFDTRDLVKSNLDKRDYEFLAKNTGEAQMTESKLWGTSKTSFQDVGEARIVVRHSQPVNPELPAGRTLHIEGIFIENADGERFKYPYKHLNGARALARHVAHGGTPYDSLGEHIIGLSEEMSKLRFFKGYVSRQESISEAMGTVNDKVIERIDQIKKEIHQLQTESHYKTFAETFETRESKQIPEDVMNDWIDRLTVRSFNEALKDVFPYIYNLVDESNVPVKELNADDIISATEVQQDLQVEEDFEGSIKELDDFESHIENLVKESDDLFSTDGQVQQAAIDKLNRLMASELKAGPDGTNAVMTLKGLIDDNDFTKTLQSVPAETDIRPLVQGYIKTNYPELVDKLNFGGESGVDSSSPAEPAAAAPAPAEAPAEAPAPDAAAAPTQPLPAAESVDREHKGGAREVVEFIKSFYDRDRGTFPKGEMGVMIAVKKEFGDQIVPVAKRVIETLSTIGEPRRQHHEQMEAMKKLAGLKGQEVDEAGFDDDDEDDLTASMPAWAQQQLKGLGQKSPAMPTMPKMPAIPKMPTQTGGQSSFKVNGKPVSKAEYDAFMQQHPELSKLTPGKLPQMPGQSKTQGGMNPSSELARIRKMAGMGDDKDW